MNTDIRLQLSFRNHPKTKKLRFKLGADGLVAWIWILMFAAESRSDGDLVGLDAEDLALAADYPGDADELVDVLVQTRLLDELEDGWRIHDWAENNPWAAGARERSERAKKAARARWEGDDPGTEKQGVKCKKDAPSKGRAMPRARSSNAPSPSPSPSPSPKNSRARKPIVELPDWVDKRIWLEYEQHRRELKHVATPTAARRILIKLKRYRDEHQVDPNEAIALSIERNYRGIFPEQILKERERETSEKRRPSGRPTAATRRAEAADRKRAQLSAVT
jgi:hypothetical protein